MKKITFLTAVLFGATTLTLSATNQITLPINDNFEVLDSIGAVETSGSTMPQIIMYENEWCTKGSKDTTIIPDLDEANYWFSAVENIYSAAGMLKFSTSNKMGKITSKPFATTKNTISVSFDAIAWIQTSTIKTAKVIIQYGEQADTVTIVHKATAGSWPLIQTDLQPYQVTFTAIAEATPIIFTGYKEGSTVDGRFFMDNLVIEEEDNSTDTRENVAPANVTFNGTTIINRSGLYLTVHNLTGAIVTEGNGNIDMSNQPRGIYIVRSGKAAMKIVK